MFSKTALLGALAAISAVHVTAESFAPLTSVIHDYPYDLDYPAVDASLQNEPSSLTGAYFEADAVRMAKFSGAAYCSRLSNNKVQSWSCPACTRAGSLTEVRNFSNPKRNTNGFVGYEASKNQIIVGFAGTDPKSAKNIWTDLSTASVPYAGCSDCRVHYGFYTAYVDVRASVITLINGILSRHPSASVVVTGHSLGGALAAHAIADFQSSVFGFATNSQGESVFLGSDNPAYQLSLEELEASFNADEEPETVSLEEAQEDFDSIVEEAQLLGASVGKSKFKMAYPMHTFGQPRLGNPKFAAWFQNTVGAYNLYRLTHHRDPVPHLPPLALGFQHPMTEVFYNKPQTFYNICTLPESPACSNQFTFQIGFEDHISYARYPISDDDYNC